ncbi:MAG TPA: DUF192 domain-containing protein [Caproiciproducens sp.]|nr:DUF192 domain-containing protein [Caproiciproducens sp.]
MTVQIGNKILADRIQPANSFLTRLIGLMGRKELKHNEGLLLFRCSSIHCFFMRFPIDTVYLSAKMEVLGIETVKPWRIGHIFRGTKHVLELPGGFAAVKIRVGDILVINEIQDGGAFHAG